MRKFENAEVEVLSLNETAFGPENPNKPDSEKTQVTINGVRGWKQQFGEAGESGNN